MYRLRCRKNTESKNLKVKLSKIALVDPFLLKGIKQVNARYNMDEIVNNFLIAEESGDSRCVYENELDKACFQQGMAYGNFKDLTEKTVL